MHQEIYIDVVFITNLLMDYILLRLVGIIFRCGKKRIRTFLAAVMGALFSCFILLIQSTVFMPAVILLHGLCAVAMLVTGCGLKRGSLLVKALITLYAMAFFCGGLWEALTRGKFTPGIFILLVLITYMGLMAGTYLMESLRTRSRNIYPVTLYYQGKAQSFYGFYDSGNLLMDSVNGKPVSIVKSDVIDCMLSEGTAYRLKHLKENSGELQSTEIVRLHPHFIPFQTIGHKEGMILAVTLEKLCIQTPAEVIQIDHPVIAFEVETSAFGKEYEVLLNSRLLQ
ncbi:MAG: sigma-E processing peptidase SpoIIGA [Blautia sp.]|nr:sigma-E processing peptidase SpoIIGA [Blautia sp.]